MLGDEIKEIPNPALPDVMNKQARYNGFVVSFLPYHEHGMGPETKDGETALIIGRDYYILNGDWMLAYAELAPQGIEACINFFKMKAPLFASQWSNIPD